MISGIQSNLVIVFSSCSSENSASALSERIIESGLAGCIKILPVKISIYMWKGKLIKEPEVLLMIKTLENKVEQLKHFILEHHEYETPEFSVVPVSKVNENYLVWIEQCLV